MARYQKHPLIATSSPKIRFSLICRSSGDIISRTFLNRPIQPRRHLRGLLFALSLCLWFAAAALPVHAAPLRQTRAPVDGGQHIYLLPAESTAVSVEVHIAELWVSAVGAENFVDVDTTYRFKNADSTAASPLVRVATAAGGEQGVAQRPWFSNLSVTIGDQAVGLEPTATGNYTFRANVPADGRTTVRLRYRVALGNDSLPTVYYPLSVLNQWPDAISIRAEVKLPDSIATDSWARVEPNGWTYGLATDPGRVDVKWLYSQRAPDAPIVFQYTNPNLWQQIRSLEMTPLASRTFDQYVRLGELYRTLYDTAGTAPSLRERYLAQTLAAFNNAVNRTDAPAEQRGAIHYELARLYRNHAPTVGEAQANEYAQLMVQEVNAALELLSAEDDRRTEMGRWRADGLTLLLNQAREAEEWDRALAIVDELETLPPASISQDFLQNERADLEVQKALQLLEQGQREAAFAVAGDQLDGAQLQPPAQMQNLFLRWAITVTASADQIAIVALAQTDPERQAQALSAAQEMAATFSRGNTRRTADVVAQASAAQWQSTPAIEIHIALRNGTNTAFLANLTPPGMDWILLRTLLDQLDVQVSQQGGLIWQTVAFRQPLDLSPAATQWTSMANSLQRQAQELETGAAAGAQNQDALTARVRAVHYRAMAERWRDLANQSRLYFEFRTQGIPGLAATVDATVDATADNTADTSAGTDPAPIVLGSGMGSGLNRTGGGATRAWFAAVSGPSQVFTMQAQLLNLTRLLVLVVIAATTLVIVSGLLWWLL